MNPKKQADSAVNLRLCVNKNLVAAKTPLKASFSSCQKKNDHLDPKPFK